jgi:hypothetical protein
MFQSGSEGRTAQQCAVLTRLISPLLLNVALHGMEDAAGVRYLTGTHVGHTAPAPRSRRPSTAAETSGWPP